MQEKTDFCVQNMKVSCILPYSNILTVLKKIFMEDFKILQPRKTESTYLFIL